ncbi:MAG TPA: CoA-transferase, partial [Elusimicrobiales bacterium]|nr:CoA-transferase [Elusimicrobiales bacterium]
MDPKELKRVRLVKRIAQEFPDGALVNLGIGLPTMVANHIPAGRTILLHSENGFTGLGPAAKKGEESQSIVNAGGQPVTIVPGGAFFDSAMSF